MTIQSSAPDHYSYYDERPELTTIEVRAARLILDALEDRSIHANTGDTEINREIVDLIADLIVEAADMLKQEDSQVLR